MNFYDHHHHHTIIITSSLKPFASPPIPTLLPQHHTRLSNLLIPWGPSWFQILLNWSNEWSYEYQKWLISQTKMVNKPGPINFLHFFYKGVFISVIPSYRERYGYYKMAPLILFLPKPQLRLRPTSNITITYCITHIYTVVIIQTNERIIERVDCWKIYQSHLTQTKCLLIRSRYHQYR